MRFLPSAKCGVKIKNGVRSRTIIKYWQSKSSSSCVCHSPMPRKLSKKKFEQKIGIDGKLKRESMLGASTVLPCSQSPYPVLAPRCLKEVEHRVGPYHQSRSCSPVHRRFRRRRQQIGWDGFEVRGHFVLLGYPTSLCFPRRFLLRRCLLSALQLLLPPGRGVN